MLLHFIVQGADCRMQHPQGQRAHRDEYRGPDRGADDGGRGYRRPERSRTSVAPAEGADERHIPQRHRYRGRYRHAGRNSRDSSGYPCALEQSLTVRVFLVEAGAFADCCRLSMVLMPAYRSADAREVPLTS
jgi:hypothetical protein